MKWMRGRSTKPKGFLRDLWCQRAGVLSTQVLYEFCVKVTRKIATALPKPSARAVVDSYTVWCVDTTPAEISAAFRIEDEAGIGFWDVLIIAAACRPEPPEFCPKISIQARSSQGCGS
jgi:predicted nucleic acid-binding protein